MSNSGLATVKKISPNKTAPRNKPITKITIHHTAGVLSAESIGNVFVSTSRQASCNYGIGNDGKVVLVVDEKDRSWCSSSSANDHQAVTIEVSDSSTGGDWPVSAAAYNMLIDLCADICKRNNIKSLIYDGTSGGSLTSHRMFASTTCPGPYLLARFPAICSAVNARISGTSSPPVSQSDTFTVRVTASVLNIRTGPGTNYGANGSINKEGVYTIVETCSGIGSTKGWGKLKSGAGWISLDYATRL
ncbi:MAG: N-acetylmuramoyl-L-alanine amidase [Betaproteobacteria bacterium]|nr:N-acetylmuramoyl-L-alanine amidase [Betaproteobacteria bacterium]